MTRVLFATLTACAIALTATAQDLTFSTRRELVRLDVLVSDRGRPVTNLRAADFEVLDSGVPQQATFIGLEQLPINVVFALDTSASISQDRLQQLREAAAALVGLLEPDDQSGLVTFADGISVRSPLVADAARARTALAQMTSSSPTLGGTALVDASYTSMSMLDDDAGRGLLIVFTDGIDTSSWLTPQSVLQAARRSNTVVYAISTASLPRSSFLRQLSETTGGRAMALTATDTLRSLFVKILDEFRQRYVLTFSPENVPSGGWHPLTVRVRTGKPDVQARPGYTRGEGR